MRSPRAASAMVPAVLIACRRSALPGPRAISRPDSIRMRSLRVARRVLDRPSGEGASAARARAGGATEAVIPGTDPPVRQGTNVEPPNRLRQARLEAQLEHLVEVAVVEPPVVAHADQGS